jgi:hypothetical protein
VLLYLERDVVFQLTRILPAVASIYPCAQQQKLVKLVLPVENLRYSFVHLDGGYMKRSFVRSQWFLLSSETTASRVAKDTRTCGNQGIEVRDWSLFLEKGQKGGQKSGVAMGITKKIGESK